MEILCKNLIIKKESNEKIWIIYINREKQANSIDKATAGELATVFRKFEADEKASVAILTGKGESYFCAGADLKKLKRSNFQNNEANEFKSTGNAPLGVSRMILNKPVIAAINGYAVAGGLELALWCDLRVTYADAILGVFCRRFGVPLIDGGTFRLSKLIGLSRAMDLILTGREVTGMEGHEIGLINRLVEKGNVLSEAIKLAELICSFPQETMRNDRMSLLETSYSNYDSLSQTEYYWGKKSLDSFEASQGADKFISGQGRHGNMLPKF
jgi:enoyl-CoA hydratase